jgi:hypothetical protein
VVVANIAIALIWFQSTYYSLVHQTKKIMIPEKPILKNKKKRDCGQT